MIEFLGDENFVLEGDVLSIADYYPDIDESPDGAVIDEIISGIKRKDTAERAQATSPDVTAIAQRALYLLDKDSSVESIRTSVESHPSMHQVPSENKAKAADAIIQAYYEKIDAYKKSIDTTELDHDVLVAIIRNEEKLDDTDLERIAVSLGHDKDYFKPKAQLDDKGRAREPDFRERQFKD